MKKELLALTAISMMATADLSARRLMCEDCEPQPIECDEHLFVERSQVFITGEFLYWTVEEGALDYAVKMNQTSDSPTIFAIGDYQIAKYDWRPGVRVALSYYRCPRYWEVMGQYTWYDGKGSNQASDPSDPDLFLSPTWDTLNDGPFVRATSSIDLNYQVGDALVSRVFDPNPHLRMKLIGGLTTAYIKQDWNITYTEATDILETVENKWRYWGGGIRMGLKADWFWGCQFYFTGQTTFAALIGSYKTETKRTESIEGLIGASKYKDDRFAFHAQFLLGPSWQVPCDCWSFELFAGYEFNVWLNLHEAIRTTANMQDDVMATRYANGLTGLHGLTLRATLGF